jgi:hypothetical protein
MLDLEDDEAGSFSKKKLSWTLNFFWIPFWHRRMYWNK